MAEEVEETWRMEHHSSSWLPPRSAHFFPQSGIPTLHLFLCIRKMKMQLLSFAWKVQTQKVVTLLHMYRTCLSILLEETYQEVKILLEKFPLLKRRVDLCKGFANSWRQLCTLTKTSGNPTNWFSNFTCKWFKIQIFNKHTEILSQYNTHTHTYTKTYKM